MSDEQDMTGETGDGAAPEDTNATGPIDPTDAANETGAPEQGDESARRPSPGATAASRARRIGGRPMPTPAGREAQRTSAPAKGDEPQPAKQSASLKKTPSDDDQPRRPLPVDLLAMQRRLDRLRWIPAVIAGLALVAVLVVGVWQSHGVWWGKKLGDTRTEQQQRVLAAAKSCTAAILSYDYKRLDQTQAAAEACITGQFKQDYDQSFELVRTAAPEKSASQTFQIANGGVSDVSSDGKQWVVMLYGQIGYTDSTVKNGPRLDISTPIVTLTEVNGKWLVSKMDTI
jgi:Mce-associated membrane protein